MLAAFFGHEVTKAQRHKGIELQTKSHEGEMLAAFFLTRRLKGTKARSFLFRAKLAKEQGRKGIELQTKSHEGEMLAAFF